MKLDWRAAALLVLLFCLGQAADAQAEAGIGKIIVNDIPVEVETYLSDGTIYAEAQLLILLQGGTRRLEAENKLIAYFEGNIFIFEIGKSHVISGNVKTPLKHALIAVNGKLYLPLEELCRLLELELTYIKNANEYQISFSKYRVTLLDGNNLPLWNENQAYMKEGEVMISPTVMMSRMDGRTSYSDSESSITLYFHDGSTGIEFREGSLKGKLNGKDYWHPVEPDKRNDRFIVPLSSLAEAADWLIIEVKPFKIYKIIKMPVNSDEVFDFLRAGLSQEIPSLKQKMKNMPDGQGELQISEHLIYKGQFKKGIATGKGIIEFDGDTVYDGYVQNLIPHGQGTLVIQEKNRDFNDLFSQTYNVNKYSGQFVNGQLNGDGRFEKDSKLIYEGAWKDHKYHGAGTLYHPNGKLQYEGLWVKGQKEGAGTLYRNNDSLLYTGTFKQDRYHSKGTLFRG